jgi:hypothetical protein
MANTNILIKRSELVGVPGSLLAGELAYSYASNTIFIGTPGSNGVVNVGGQYYTSQVDNATDAATGSTLVKRDATGNASFNYVFANIVGEIIGNANSATQLQTARNFSIDGTDITASAVSFNGTGDVVLNASLDEVPGLGAGTYGSTTEIPVVTVGANGRVLAISTSTISTQFEVEGDTGTTTIEGGETFYMVGGDGITSEVTANTVTFDVDNTVIRTLASVGPQTIDTDLLITGNVNITGNVISHGADDLIINDPIILLANNNVGDLLDIGFVGHYVESGNTLHAGLVRHAASDTFYLFKDYVPHIQENNILNIADPTLVVSGLYANLISKSSQIDTINSSTGIVTIDDDLTVNGDLVVSGDLVIDDIQSDSITANTLTLTNALTVPNGGTGVTSFASGQIVIGSGTNGLQQIANSSVAVGQTFGSASSVAAFETDVYGRVVTVSNTAIAIDTSQITSGTLGYNRGGTGATSYTTGALLVAGASGFESVANTTYVQTGSFASNNTITSVTVDAYGRFTAATVGAIGGLTVGQGGTGRTTFTTNGIIYGNSTDGMLVTAAAGTADQSWSNQIMTVTNAGVPVWTTALDGGQF